MSLRRIKTLYCVAVISIGVLLASHGEVVSWAASVIVLSGALPMFNAVSGAMKTATLHDVEQQAQIIADQTELSQQLKPRQDRRSQSV